MNIESQNIEWKESWRDEYIKWICGFANAKGGKIIIGADDNGIIQGIANAKKLLEDLPNKIRDILGIMVDINLKSENKKEFIEIIVDAYPSPVSYKGQYFYRSGSTKQELKGTALEKFLLQKIGKKWDGVLTDYTVNDLTDKAFDIFKKEAAKGTRIPKEALNDTKAELLEELHLTDNNKLKRSAYILFGKDPEKLVTGAYVKIGYFKTDDDLIFHNDVHGSLFEQVETTLDLLYTKYFKEILSYSRSTRIEDVYPEKAIREALLNALTHKDYPSGIPVQISVYNDKVIFWNPGTLPQNWTIENLKKKHPSIAPNADIAGTFFRCGYIDTWGRGTIKLINACIESGLPEPRFESDGNGVTVTIRRNIIENEYLQNISLNERQIKALLFMKSNGEMTNAQYSKMFDVTDRTALRDLKELIEKGFIQSYGLKKGTKYHLI
ncbi:MAG: putative DNA binding domain-containing protein [Bacteroidales bacterium]|nr:putative DNA binding domain-containing protein [Bacteroidales bacterium]